MHRQKTKLTHDDYYNLLLVAHELDEFMFEIITFPDLTCFFGNPDLLKEFNEVLELSKIETDMRLYCSYDTTFNIGNFYVTPLVFRHTLFANDPVISVAFMLHERKFQMVHERFYFGNT